MSVILGCFHLPQPRSIASDSDMASMGGGHLTAAQLVKRITEGKLLNKALVDICKVEGLRTGGNKLELQTRLVNRTFAAS